MYMYEITLILKYSRKEHNLINTYNNVPVYMYIHVHEQLPVIRTCKQYIDMMFIPGYTSITRDYIALVTQLARKGQNYKAFSYSLTGCYEHPILWGTSVRTYVIVVCL